MQEPCTTDLLLYQEHDCAPFLLSKINVQPFLGTFTEASPRGWMAAKLGHQNDLSTPSSTSLSRDRAWMFRPTQVQGTGRASVHLCLMFQPGLRAYSSHISVNGTAALTGDALCTTWRFFLYEGFSRAAKGQRRRMMQLYSIQCASLRNSRPSKRRMHYGTAEYSHCQRGGMEGKEVGSGLSVRIPSFSSRTPDPQALPIIRGGGAGQGM